MLRPKTQIVLLAVIMTVLSVVSPGVVLCIECDGTSHLELGIETCCSPPDTAESPLGTNVDAVNPSSDCGGCTDVGIGDVQILRGLSRPIHTAAIQVATPLILLSYPAKVRTSTSTAFARCRAFIPQPARLGGFDDLALNC